MIWVQPNYSWNQVDKAGKNLIKSTVGTDEYYNSLFIVNNWRGSHQYPLNTFQMTLRRKARRINQNAIVSQRIKRLESIERKLSQSTMQLSQMQDIGGARAVMPKIQDVRGVLKLYQTAEFGHEPKGGKDYIDHPKVDGYRSLHLIYRYKGEGKNACYDDQQIELQIRTQLQHAWATAVEAVGTFTKQALKWKGGDAEWRRFFVLMSSAIATIENCPIVENTPSDKKELAGEIEFLANKLHVQATLKAYGLTMDYMGQLRKSKAKLLLVHMKPDEGKVQVRGFQLKESQFANMAYASAEGNLTPSSASQVVLVKVDSL